MGQVISSKKLTVKVPAGVDHGSQMRLKGEGEPGRNGGPAGSLYIVLHVKPSDVFHREGDDIIVSVPVTFSQAALGAEIEIPTIEGKRKFKVPPATQSGAFHKLQGLGAPRLRGYGRGDLIVQLAVATPSNLSKRQEELFRELAELDGGEVKHKSKGLFEKLMG
jgi:molecular chaperone DnaJ